jgi:hypothetical protein
MKKSKSEIGEIHRSDNFSHICHSEALAEESICITFPGSFAFAQDDKAPTFLNLAMKNPQVFCTCGQSLATFLAFSGDNISFSLQLQIQSDFSSNGIGNNSILSQYSFNTSETTYSFSNILVVQVE